MEKYYLDEEADYQGIPSITSCYDEKKPFPLFIERYFSQFYAKGKSENGDNEDHSILFHTNGICLIGLAKSHIAFKKGIKSITFDIGNCDRSQTQVKGKHKKGAMNLQKDTTLAIVTTNDGCEYKVFSCITGKLLEVNEKLKDDLKKMDILGHGYIAIVLPKTINIEKEKQTLVKSEDYVPS